VGELRKFLKCLVKPALAEVLISGGKARGLFEQRRGVRAHIDAMGSRLTAQFLLYFGLDIDDDGHWRSLFFVVSPAKMSTGLTIMRGSGPRALSRATPSIGISLHWVNDTALTLASALTLST
jgi:hypothetical protein